MDTTGPSTHVMGLRCVRMRIGVVDGVFGRSHAPAGEEGGGCYRQRDLHRGCWATRAHWKGGKGAYIGA